MWRKSLGSHTCPKSAKMAKKWFQRSHNLFTFPKNTVNGVSSLEAGDRGVELIQQSSSQHRYQQLAGLSLACTWPHTSCCQGTCHCITSAQGWAFWPQCNLYTHYSHSTWHWSNWFDDQRNKKWWIVDPMDGTILTTTIQFSNVLQLTMRT